MQQSFKGADQDMQGSHPLSKDELEMQFPDGAKELEDAGKRNRKAPRSASSLQCEKWLRCLSRWRQMPEKSSEREMQEFFQAMLGKTGQEVLAASSTQHVEAGFETSLCLAELTVESLPELLGHPGPKGLMPKLRPYLEDLLTRRRGFRGVADLLAAAADGEDGSQLPRVLAELTAKDLFIAFLLASPAHRRARVAAAYARLRAPVPVVFSVPAGPEGSPPTTTCIFQVLQELACVPQAGRELVVSLGTRRVSGGGKTQLLGELALTPMPIDELDARPSGPMHYPSCDVFCTNSHRWVVDVHGYWAGVDDDFRTAVMAITHWGQAMWLLHCASADFNSKTGAPTGELQEMLSALGSRSDGTEGGSSGSVILLVRDVAASETRIPTEAADHILQDHGVVCLGIVPVEDCRAFKSPARRTAAVERLRVGLQERIAKAWPRGGATPSLEDLTRLHTVLFQESHADGRWSCPAPPPGPVENRRSTLGAKFVQLLDAAHSTGATVSALFPLSVINRRLTALRRTDASSGTSEAAPSAPPSAKEQLKLAEDRAQAREADTKKLEGFLAAARVSPAMAFFHSTLAGSGPTAIPELGLYLEDWKEPRILPLLERQRELLDRSSAEGQTTIAGGSPDLKTLGTQLESLDFSMDSFWVELELLSERQKKQTGENQQLAVDIQSAQACMSNLVNDSCPFQVLHSTPLCMAGNFIRGVLETIGAQQSDPRGIFVVSVIGAQSSAKSTLLNFLFGSGFAVSAGRCTRGLYASYFKPAGSPPVLVLDSEGLLSLGSEGAVFDGQIALMCMSCSHLVLVNHKGELSRQLQDLLEICLFAMRHLRLNRLKPRLVFVLRDQHDRSNTVHEDMLKQMRNHLEEVAQTLGSPLEDLIRLDGTAVFLLPSAITSELQHSSEVSWTSELFSREVLRLRGEVFRWLRDDADARGDVSSAEFGSLTAWYDYATTVWETLSQFGGRLLHYKTIHDIELRRELAGLAKTAIQDMLEGKSGSTEGGDGSLGFHKRALQMVDSFVSRVKATPTKLDLDTIDMELARALACLRDECITQLEDLFEERTTDPRFTLTAKEQAKKQIRTPIEWAFENHLYTWKLHLKRFSDELAMHALWVHFTGVLNQHLTKSGHRSIVSEAQSQKIFESEWHAYETQYLDRHKSLTKDWQTLAHEVTLLFNHAVAKLQFETGALALLKETGPQLVSVPPEKRREAGMPSITDQTDEEWEEQYFYVGWWATVRKRGMALLQNSGAGMLENLIPRMRKVVQQGLQQFQLQVLKRGSLDEATAADGLRHISGVVLQDIESRILNDWSVGTLKRAQMLHALHVALRLNCIEALVALEATKQEQAMKDLHSQKAHVEEHFLLIIQTNKGDVDRAANFAKMYHRTLTSWIDHEITSLAAEVRSQVLQEMPDPQKSSERAFQQSFGAQNWPAVLEYVLDMNAYLEKVFLTLFHQKKRSYVGAARSRLEKRIATTYRLLQDVAMEWARRESGGDTPKVDVSTGPAAVTTQLSVRELKDFITTHAERVPGNAEQAEAHRQLAERLPATADFPIADPRLFAEAFQTRLGDFIDSPDVAQHLAKKLDEALKEQSVRAWSLIKGCRESCPLCGSKCDIVGEHAHHHCTHHLFPAFHGWMDRSTGLPSFNHCLGCSTREGTYECKDGTWRNLEDYLNADHPSWLPFTGDQAASDRDVQLLRAAWVNCREPFLEYFSPMVDFCPAEWQETYDTGRGLTVADLKVAKDTIRKLRDHTWSPPDD